jgi:predicted molibdopterin-dependent oxidoreductase YjgC
MTLQINGREVETQAGATILEAARQAGARIPTLCHLSGLFPSAVVVDCEGEHVLICKGSVEDVFQVCRRYQLDEEILPLLEVIKADVL